MKIRTDKKETEEALNMFGSGDLLEFHMIHPGLIIPTIIEICFEDKEISYENILQECLLEDL